MASILFGSAEGIEFGPPPEKRSARAFMLAIFAHLLLLGALTWGVNWKRSDQAASFEAELWSAVPQQAAPRAVEPPPPPPAPTPPAPRPAPEPLKVAPPAPDVDIALEQEKKRKLLQKQKEVEAQKLEERENREKAELQAKREKEKEQKTKEDIAKRKAADEAKKLEAQKQDAKEQQQQKLADAAAQKQRQENIARMNAQLGATGDANATGTAQRSSGPSASYGGLVRAKVKPYILFTQDTADNPVAEVEVRTTPDGTIISQRVVKSSGNKAWDDAVVNAIIRTETMPRDADGRVPTPMILTFRRKELL